MCIRTIWSKYVNVKLKTTLMECKYSIYVVYPVINTISRKIYIFLVYIFLIYIAYIYSYFPGIYSFTYKFMVHCEKETNVRANDCKWLNSH